MGSTIVAKNRPRVAAPAAPRVGAAAAAAPTRAVREPGRRMRSQLLDAASTLFKSNGLAATSVSDIAEAAGGFPSQVTYYFRTKEALFVETACREVLYVAQQAEQAASTTRTLDAYIGALVSQVARAAGLAMFIEALALVRHRQDLAPLIARTVQRLHIEGARAYADIRTRRGWPVADDPALRARRFWALVFGVALSSAACSATSGAAPDHARKEILELLRAEWRVQPAAARARKPLPAIGATRATAAARAVRTLRAPSD